MVNTYQKEDKAALLMLFQQNTPAYFHPTEEADFISFLENEAEHYFVFREGKEIIGCGGFALGDEDAQSACLCWDMVHPEHHGKGIGQQLVQYRLERLRALPNLSRVFVRTSQIAAPFYAKQGFEWKFSKKDFWAPGFDLHYMEQILH